MEDIFDQLTAKKEPAPDVVEPIKQPQAEPAQGTGYTPLSLKQCCQELLKFGILEMDRKPHLYQTALMQQEPIRSILEPFDLNLKLDDIRGLAFLTLAENVLEDNSGDDWTHPLVRRQRLTLEQSLLLAILRKHYLNHEQETGIGAGGAVVYVDDLIPELQIYLPELGSDVKEQTRARNLLEKLKGHGMVSEIDSKEQITIRPIIVHLADPNSLQALLQQYRRLAQKAGA